MNNNIFKDNNIFNDTNLSSTSACSTKAPCLTDTVKNELAKEVNVKTNDESTILDATLSATNCGQLTCSLKRIAESNVIIKKSLPEIFAALKPRGPRNTTQLLSNFDIDAVMSRWAAEVNGFFNCEYSMIDFDRVKSQFGVISLPEVMAGRVSLNLGPYDQNVKRPSDCFGCVLNTDVSTGPGRHWVAVFVDCRPGLGKPWTVEYFNSTGNPPCRDVVNWMQRTKDELVRYRTTCCISGTASDAVRSGVADNINGGKIDPNTLDLRPVIATPVSSVSHQKNDTECGVYSLFFIRKRLVGVPYTYFQDHVISDREVQEFRKYIFRD